MAAAESSPVTVSWRAVEDAYRYTVTFSQVQGTNQQGLCPSGSHTASTTVDGVTTASIPVGEDVETTDDMLRAYTTYAVTVVAVSDARGTSSPSDTETVTTPQTGKSDLGISVVQYLYKWKNHFYEMKGDVGMSLHEKGRNKKMPTPRHKVTHNPIPTFLFCFNMLFVCLFVMNALGKANSTTS